MKDPTGHNMRLVSAMTDDPDVALQFYLTASEIVDDFEEWGPVLQANLDGHYDETSAIIRLQRLRNKIIELTRPPS